MPARLLRPRDGSRKVPRLARQALLKRVTRSSRAVEAVVSYHSVTVVEPGPEAYFVFETVRGGKLLAQ